MFDAAPRAKCNTSATLSCATCPRAQHCLGQQLGNAVCFTNPSFGRGEHLFHSGDSVEFLYVVRKGAVKSYLVSADGLEQIVGFHGVGDIVGFDSIANREFQGNAVAIDATEVCRLPAGAIRRQMAESDTFRQAFFGDMGREIQRLHRLLHLERCTAEQRVAAFLLSQLRKHRQEGARVPRVDLPMSRAEIGSFLDLATETVSRMFTRLQERAVIKVIPGAAEVIDLASLVEASQANGTAEAASAKRTAASRPAAPRGTIPLREIRVAA